MNKRNIFGGEGGRGEGCRCIGPTTLTLSSADYPEIWGPFPPGTRWACNRSVQGLLYLYLYFVIIIIMSFPSHKSFQDFFE